MLARLTASACILILITCCAASATDTAPSEDALPAATRITLHLKHVTAQEALDQLQKAAKVELSADSETINRRLQQARVSIDADQEPLMSVLVSICDAAGVRPLRYTTDRLGMILGDADGAWAGPFTAVEGPYAIGLTKVEQERRIVYGGNGLNGPTTYTLSIEVLAEPAVSSRLQSVAQTIVRSCLDQDGTSIRITDPPRSQFDSKPPLITTVQMQSDKATNISSLEGACTLAVSAAPKHVDVPNLMAVHDVAVDLGGKTRMTINQFSKTGNFYAMKVLLERDELNDAALNLTVKTISASKLIFLDADGKDMGLVFRFSSKSNAPTGTLMTLNFTSTMPQDPQSLSWDVPTALSSVVVPFQFKDVPVPVPTGK